MLNLLISGDPEKWKLNTDTFEHDRCLTEYIMPELRTRFGLLGDDEIAQLIQLPAIFAYEQSNHKDALIGRIKHITKRQQNVKIDYELTGERIAFDVFSSLESLLDIGKWELNRTHWTVKNVDIADAEPYFDCKRGRQPTVFISYSWTPPENQRSVFNVSIMGLNPSPLGDTFR